MKIVSFLISSSKIIAFTFFCGYFYMDEINYRLDRVSHPMKPLDHAPHPMKPLDHAPHPMKPLESQDIFPRLLHFRIYQDSCQLAMRKFIDPITLAFSRSSLHDKYHLDDSIPKIARAIKQIRKDLESQFDGPLLMSILLLQDKVKSTEILGITQAQCNTVEILWRYLGRKMASNHQFMEKYNTVARNNFIIKAGFILKYLE